MKYPLCARAGLKVQHVEVRTIGAHIPEDVIRAADVEKWLEGAPVVNAYNNDKVYWSTNNDDGDTHTARLVMIEPIVKDTAESLLREIVQDHEALCRFQGKESEWELYKRARRLLEAK